jgi:hypothetical protein
MAWGVVWLSSCHKPRTRKVTEKEISVKVDSIISNPDSLAIGTIEKSATEAEGKLNFSVEEIDFDYLTAKSKFSFKNETQNIDNANVSIRIKKDSLIWFSVNGVGFEVARGIITPDTIVFMDKFHKEYYAYSYEQLSREFNFDLSYGLLQSIIVGNLPVPRTPNEKVRREKDFLLLRQDDGRIMLDSYIGEKNRKLKRLQAVEQPTKNSLTLDYEDFTELNSYLFPFTSLITLDVQSKKDKKFYQTVMRIKHSKVELPSKAPGFPFTIPQSYQKK